MKHTTIGLILLALAMMIAPPTTSAKNRNYAYSVKTQKFESYWPESPSNMNKVNRYDALGRLVFSGTFTYDKAIEATTWSYDPNGNMIKKSNLTFYPHPRKRHRYLLRTISYMSFDYGKTDQSPKAYNIPIDETTFRDLTQEIFVQLKNS